MGGRRFNREVNVPSNEWGRRKGSYLCTLVGSDVKIVEKRAVKVV